MDVVINELNSTIELTSDEGLVDPAVLRRVVRAVSESIREQEEGRRWQERETGAPARGRGRGGR
jgi:hypothetical protein